MQPLSKRSAISVNEQVRESVVMQDPSFIRKTVPKHEVSPTSSELGYKLIPDHHIMNDGGCSLNKQSKTMNIFENRKNIKRSLENLYFPTLNSDNSIEGINFRNAMSSESRSKSSQKISPDNNLKSHRTSNNIFRCATSKTNSPRWTQKDLSAALQLVRSGTPIKPAAEKCNMPVMTLWRRTRALGLVSSKVQCGFRYPTRGSIKSNKSSITPISETNYSLTGNSRSTDINKKNKFNGHVYENHISKFEENNEGVSSRSCSLPSILAGGKVIEDGIDPVCTPSALYSNTTNNIPIFSTQIQFLQQLQSHDTVVNSANRNSFMKFIDYSNPVLVPNESQQPINLTTNSDSCARKDNRLTNPKYAKGNDVNDGEDVNSSRKEFKSIKQIKNADKTEMYNDDTDTSNILSKQNLSISTVTKSGNVKKVYHTLDTKVQSNGPVPAKVINMSYTGESSNGHYSKIENLDSGYSETIKETSTEPDKKLLFVESEKLTNPHAITIENITNASSCQGTDAVSISASCELKTCQLVKDFEHVPVSGSVSIDVSHHSAKTSDASNSVVDDKHVHLISCAIPFSATLSSVPGNFHQGSTSVSSNPRFSTSKLCDLTIKTTNTNSSRIRNNC